MAKNSTLREFQQAILLKLKEAAEQSGAVATSRLGVTVGSKNLLINLKDVIEVLPVPPLQSVPLTQPWFLGVANVRGNLYNITDLAQFSGMPPTPKSTHNRILLLRSEVTIQAALVVDAIIGLRNTESMQLNPLINESEATDHEALFSKRIYQDIDHNVWYELDIEALAQNKEFIQPSIS